MIETAVAPQPTTAVHTGPILVCLPPLSAAARETVFANLAAALGDTPVIAAVPEYSGDETHANIRAVPYATGSGRTTWLPAAADYIAADILAREHNAAAVILLANDAETLPASSIRSMAAALAEGRDLVLPRYAVGPHEALLNAGILYPLTRALFAYNAHFPLPVDVAFSARMGDRLAGASRKHAANGLGEALIWPVAEAALASFTVIETEPNPRFLPQPPAEDVANVLASVTASLFTDVEAKAAFWQRARLTQHNPGPATVSASPMPAVHPDLADDVHHQLEAFRLAYTNLRELWSLVLPPNTLLLLKKLSAGPIETFRIPDELWARTVYDFLLAYRLRTINRGHLLGAFTPLYLAWVASHIRQVQGNAALATEHIAALATAFENEKPYLVSRWRWPDRFNP